MLRKFRLRLHWQGSPWIKVEAHDVDEACDKAAVAYGWKDYADMRASNKHWSDDDGFKVELDREGKDGSVLALVGRIHGPGAQA